MIFRSQYAEDKEPREIVEEYHEFTRECVKDLMKTCTKGEALDIQGRACNIYRNTFKDVLRLRQTVNEFCGKNELHYGNGLNHILSQKKQLEDVCFEMRAKIKRSSH